MKERPILFSGPMVRAILAGRKTQTRRVVKDVATCGHTGKPYWPGMKHGGDFVYCQHCPFGQPGDRLWVRETWAPKPGLKGFRETYPVIYRADIEAKYPNRDPGKGWRPSIHMPRWASRLTLQVTEVRVEALCAINNQDGRAEGYESAEHFLSGEWAAPLRGQNPWVWAVSFRRVASDAKAGAA